MCLYACLLCKEVTELSLFLFAILSLKSWAVVYMLIQNYVTKRFAFTLPLAFFRRDMYSRCCFLAQMDRCFGKKPCCSFVAFSGAYIRMLTVWTAESFKKGCKALLSSRGCFGCCTKPSLIIAVDKPSKGLRIQGQTVKKSSVSEDFWSSGTCEMDNSAIQSQRSLSSISMSNQPLDPFSSAGSTSNPAEFVNHGLLLWNRTRQQWLANKKPHDRTQVREPTISWNATYESLLGTNKPFSRPIPLPEMVDFLVDVWEQEGLYD